MQTQDSQQIQKSQKQTMKNYPEIHAQIKLLKLNNKYKYQSIQETVPCAWRNSKKKLWCTS